MSAQQFLSGVIMFAHLSGGHFQPFSASGHQKPVSALPQSVAGVRSDHTQTHAHVQLFIVPSGSGGGQVNKKCEVCVFSALHNFFIKH